MKTHLHLSLALLAVLSAGLAAAAMAADQSAPDGKKFYMVVVADRTDQDAKPALPTPDHPAYYVAYDAGYIEEGDPIGGVHPPPATVVAQALRETLASQNYLPASAAPAPALLLVYHWGLLNRDTHQIRDMNQLQPNLKARITLVAPDKYAKRIEEDLLDRRQPVSVLIPILDPIERDLLDLTRDDRYFVIVSAYDFAALTRRETKLLWRVRMSTRSPGVSMAEGLPALLSGGAPFLGRHVTEMQSFKAPLFPAGLAATGAAPAQEFLPPPEAARQIDAGYLRHLMYQEHIEFSGLFAADLKESAYQPTIPTSQ